MKKTMCLLFLMAVTVAGANDLEMMKTRIAAEHPIKSVDKFYGFDRVVFDFQGYEAWVVCPEGETKAGTPWTWVMQWATAFVKRTNVPQLLRAGYHHVTINTFKHRMDETGLKVSADFQRFLVDRLGFAPKANLIGMSWGGFFSIRYANRYPQNVAKIYLDAPLLNFGKFRYGTGPWEERQPTDGWEDSPEMPINMAPAIAKAGIPILLLYGGADNTCVPSANGELFERRFRDAGGDIDSIQRACYAHHPHGVELDETTILDFFERRKQPPVVSFADERIGDWRSAVLPLNHKPGENGFYLLSFKAKGVKGGFWTAETFDAQARPLPVLSGKLDASDGIRAHEILVETRPDAQTIKLSIAAGNAARISDLRLKRVSVAEALRWAIANYQKGPAFKGDIPASVWKGLPNARIAIKVAKDFSIVFAGDARMAEFWTQGFDAAVRQEYPDTDFRCWLTVGDAATVAADVATCKPQLVVLCRETVTGEEVAALAKRCREQGAEFVIASATGANVAAAAGVPHWTIPSGGSLGAWILWLHFNAAQK